MSKYNILLAEDEEFIAKLYALELETKKDVSVTIVGNGQEVIDAMKSKKFNLLLLDLLMPDMDGFSVLEELKRKKIKIPKTIVLTNLSQEIDRKKCMDLGAVGYLIKSDTSATSLWEKIQELV